MSAACLQASLGGVMGDVPVMCFAVDTGDGVLVFDTGIHGDVQLVHSA